MEHYEEIYKSIACFVREIRLAHRAKLRCYIFEKVTSDQETSVKIVHYSLLENLNY